MRLLVQRARDVRQRAGGGGGALPRDRQQYRPVRSRGHGEVRTAQLRIIKHFFQNAYQ